MDSWEERLDDEDAAVYPIGVVAELLGASVQVVRRYDDDDMVQPGRSDGGQRRYSRRDIARLARILELGSEGISAPGIRRILDLEDKVAELEPDVDPAEGPPAQKGGRVTRGRKRRDGP